MELGGLAERRPVHPERLDCDVGVALPAAHRPAGPGQGVDQEPRGQERAAGDLAEPQVLPVASGGQLVAGPSAPHRGHGRRAGPGAGQCAREELHQVGEHTQGQGGR